ncbi:MAG: LacI family DNA-binding transcriptional regulator [Phycisphaerae bacterium]
MAATIYDIAKKLGISHATVSRGLRNNPEIALSTRDKIQKAAIKLNYTPNILARGLAGNGTHTVGVLWTLSTPHQSGEMARRIAMRAQQHGWVTYIADNMKDKNVIERVTTDFINRGVEAVVVELSNQIPLTSDLEKCLNRFKTAVIVTSSHRETQLDQVVHDRFDAIRAVVGHFAKSGRKRPGIMVPVKTSQPKIDVYLDEFRKYGIDPGTQAIIDIGFEEELSGERLLQVLRSKYEENKTRFDCLFCSGDELATMAISYLASKGLQIPRDIAVVGFNDNETSKFMIPPMASVARKDQEVANIIEHLLFSRLEKRDIPPRQETIAMEFIWRESAG